MSSLLVTGGTGTFGRAFVRAALADSQWSRVIVFSRDEVKQHELSQLARGWAGAMKLRMFLGDVRDSMRLRTALRGVDAVIHAAALKRVDQGAYSPGEMIETNIIGTRHVVDQAIEAGVGRVVVVSSDKAVQATNIYGVSKAAAEFYAVHANAYAGRRDGSRTRIAAVRYGNVLGSRGSVLGIWRQQIAEGVPLTITHRAMTRFLMTIEQAVELVNAALWRMRGGEVFIPSLPAATMLTLAKAVMLEQMPLLAAERLKTDDWFRETGLRPGGEKLAEQLLSEEEPRRTRYVQLPPRGDLYIVLPAYHEWTTGDEWLGQSKAVPENLLYRSDFEADGCEMKPEDLLALIAGSEACRA
jgi:UDP-N-acetylglucosamine 4,6-dehydratase